MQHNKQAAGVGIVVKFGVKISDDMYLVHNNSI